MAALTGPRKTKKFGEDPILEFLSYPQKGNTICYQGGIVVLGSDGFARPARLNATDVVLGRCAENQQFGGLGFDTTATGPNGLLADGIGRVKVEAGIFLYDSGTGVDALADTNRGQDVYLSDDHTVNLTSAGGTRSYGGKLICLDYGSVGQVSNSSQAYVLMAPWLVPQSTGQMFTMPIKLSAVANAGIAMRFVPGFKGFIRKVEAIVWDPVTTGSKAVTLTPAINGTNTTGVTLALTSANCTPLGARVAQTGTFTANATFQATDEITLVASSVTAFVEGQVWIQMFCE
jgi:hypothetical protein